MIVRKVNAKKKKGKEIKGYDKVGKLFIQILCFVNIVKHYFLACV